MRNIIIKVFGDPGFDSFCLCICRIWGLQVFLLTVCGTVTAHGTIAMVIRKGRAVTVLSVFLQGIGMARISVGISIDSGETWTNDSNLLVVQEDALEKLL